MSLKRKLSTAIAVLASIALGSAVASAAADDSVPFQKGLAPAPAGPVFVGFGEVTPEKTPVLLAAEKGVYHFRVIGPDGKVYEHQVSGGMSAEQLNRVKARLKELQAAAGDAQAVQRISQELLQELTAAEEDRTALGSDKPHYGLGVSLAPEVPAALRAHLKLGAEEGLLVASVAAGSPAEKAGIKEYDLLLKVGDQSLTRPGELVEAVQKAGEASQTVKLEVLSAGERRVVEVAPTKSNEIGWKVSGLPLGVPPWGGIGKGEPLTGTHQYLIQKVPLGIAAPVTGLPLGGAVPPAKSPFPAGDEAVKKLEERIRALEERLSKLAAQLEDRPVKQKEDQPIPEKESTPPGTKEPDPSRTKDPAPRRTKDPETTTPK
jgi:uncharacterized coiled-coil protein SlyX